MRSSKMRLLPWFAAPAQAAVTYASAGSTTCAAASSCTVTLSQSIAAGSYVLVLSNTGSNINGFTITAADNASNCGSAYMALYTNSNTNSSIIARACFSTTNAMTTGNTITVTSSAGTPQFTVTVLVVSGSNATFDKAGTNVTGTYTNGAVTTFATSPTPGYTSESALAIVAANVTATSDSMGTITGGYSSVVSLPENSKAGMFVYSQTLTAGTATLGGTISTTTSGRLFNSVVLLIPTSGVTTTCSHARTLTGVGC